MCFYAKPSNWANWLNYTLASLRFLLIFLIGALFLIPSSKYIRYFQEKPIVAFAIDNSKSLALQLDSNRQNTWQTTMTQFNQQLESTGYDIGLTTFSDSVESWSKINFDYPTTDLNGLVEKIEHQYKNKNLASIVLLSDGIYNRGILPTYNTFRVPILTLGIGDTTPKVDLLLNTVYANKIAYLDNQFPIVIEVINKGLRGEKTEIKLINNEEIIARQIILFKDNYQIQKVRFLAKAEQTGLQNYKIVLAALPQEDIKINNTKNVFIDVLDSKEHILILALTPHPDIRAFKEYHYK